MDGSGPLVGPTPLATIRSKNFKSLSMIESPKRKNAVSIQLLRTVDPLFDSFLKEFIIKNKN